MTRQNQRWQKQQATCAFTTLILCGLVATLSPIPPAQAKLFEMSEQQEIQAGQQVAAQAEREYGGVLPPNDPRSIRVRAIGAQFAAMSARRNIPFTYKVLNNDKVLNAFAAPGGPVFVTKKLLDTTSNDAELAYVLGHETGHIEHKHVVEAAAKQQEVALGVGILGGVLSRGRNGNLIGGVSNIAFGLWRSGYSRHDEAEADAIGVRWMAWLGYDPRAAIAMLGKLGDGPDGVVQRALADHPASRDRQINVGREINEEGLMDIARRSGGPRIWANFNTPRRTTRSTSTSRRRYYVPAPGVRR